MASRTEERLNGLRISRRRDARGTPAGKPRLKARTPTGETRLTASVLYQEMRSKRHVFQDAAE